MPEIDQLATLLNDQHPSLQSLTSADVHRIRAIVFRRLSSCTVSSVIINEAISELELGDSLYASLSAAKLVSGLEKPPFGSPILFLHVVDRFISLDQPIDLQSPFNPSHTSRSGVTQLIESFVELPREQRWNHRDIWEEWASRNLNRLQVSARKLLTDSFEQSVKACCGSEGNQDVKTIVADQKLLPTLSSTLYEAEIEDQSGVNSTFGSIIKGRMNVIAFFYTRCMNPEKCARTISCLASLKQYWLSKHPNIQLGIHAITYEPEWDSPSQLTLFGNERSYPFDSKTKFLRFVTHWQKVIEEFELSVGFGAGTINRHGIDLFVLDSAGKPIWRARNSKWQWQHLYSKLAEFNDLF